jgi:uncharacterized protein (DUF736 family)
MGLNISASIKPVKTNGKEGAPTHRVFSKAQAGIDIGAGWMSKSQAGNDYISIKLDCPTLAQPIRANLIEQTNETGKFILLWDRD